MARKQGISGWHAMRKEELIHALMKLARYRISTDHISAGKHRSRTDNGTPSPIRSSRTAAGQSRPNGATSQGRVTSAKSRSEIISLQQRLARKKNLADSARPNSEQPAGRNQPPKDRLVVMVRDPYWLHAHWDLSQQNVDRARAALGKDWFEAGPVLRLFTVDENNTADLVRDIPIHGGVDHWYLEVQDPPQTHRLEIGYLAKSGNYFSLARSNTVATPPAGTSESVDNNWAHVAENADRIFAMSGGYSLHGVSQELQELLEQRLGRPMGTPMETRYGPGATMGTEHREMKFAVDAEAIVYGIVDRDAHVTLKGEPVQVRGDGTFTVRISMPDKRQVIPIVATSNDGIQQRTIILAINRNTKVMEPIYRDLTK
jgi:uncharacterized protein